jgi:Mn-dependent DtxR family transcriptional regulator
MQESGEMYLETIRILLSKQKIVRAIDVGNYMGFSKPSVSRAMSVLKRDGYVTVGEGGAIGLTDAGKKIADTILERHTVLTKMLTGIGVDPETAEKDACRMEHVISPETFDAIKKFMKDNKKKQ